MNQSHLRVTTGGWDRASVGPRICEALSTAVTKRVPKGKGADVIGPISLRTSHSETRKGTNTARPGKALPRATQRQRFPTGRPSQRCAFSFDDPRGFGSPRSTSLQGPLKTAGAFSVCLAPVVFRRPKHAVDRARMSPRVFPVLPRGLLSYDAII